ncbi:hypothetical protein Bca4012_091056 [Brassica carinata]
MFTKDVPYATIDGEDKIVGEIKSVVTIQALTNSVMYYCLGKAALSMESPEAVSSGSPPLPPEPPDPDLDVMLLVDHPGPPVPPDPPPVLLGCALLRQISLSFTTPHHRREPEAPMPWFLCAFTSFSLKLLCSDAEAGVF